MSIDAALGTKIALDCLQFFSCSGERQVATWEIARNKYQLPRLFSGDSKPATESDYFIGVGCAFKTYLGFIYDYVLSQHATESLEALNHRLSVMMHTESEVDWSAVSILNEVVWQKLRAEAKNALSTLGIVASDVAPIFDLENLIDPTEFRTSDEVRKLLE